MPSADVQSRTFQGPILWPAITWSIPEASSALAVDARFVIGATFEPFIIDEIFSETETGTVDFDIEIRPFGSMETTGTAVTSSDIQAVDGGTTTIVFANAYVPARSWIEGIVRAISSATEFAGAINRRHPGRLGGA